MCRVLRSLEGCIATIVSNWDMTWFDGVDPARITKIWTAFSRPDEFFARWKFASWFCEWMDRLMSWVGGCPCNCPQSKPCDKRGRRLPDAYEYAKTTFDEGLGEANSWGIHEFGGFVYIWQQGLAAARAVFQAGMDSIGYLDTLPWLLARLRKPGIAARCIAEYALTDREHHHPSSNEMLDPADEESLSEDVAAIDPDGNGISPRLDAAIIGFENMPLDDMVDEGPHAKGKKIIAHSTAGSFPWAASSARLDANLDIVQAWSEAFNMDLQTEWDRWSSVVKVRNTHRPLQETPKQVSCGLNYSIN